MKRIFIGVIIVSLQATTSIAFDTNSGPFCRQGYNQYRPTASNLMKIISSVIGSSVEYQGVCVNSRTLETTPTCGNKEIIKMYIEDLNDDQSIYHEMANMREIHISGLVEGLESDITALECSEE